MARSEVNRTGEMEAFAHVVEQGGFTAAAHVSGLTPSAVSKLVSRLELRLGTRLVSRSTRHLQLTPEGTLFYDRVTRILADIAEAEQSAGAADRAMGPVRFNTSASYAHHVLAPILPRFLAEHPGVTLDIALTDAVVDLVADRADVAIRAGPLKNSRLVARSLGETALSIVASPGYLAERGTPRTVSELEAHNRLGFSYARATNGWKLRSEDGSARLLPATGTVQASDGEALRQLALHGVGIARLADFTVRDDVSAGRLIRLLGERDASQTEAFYAVYVGQGGPIPRRVRAVLDFLAVHGLVS